MCCWIGCQGLECLYPGVECLCQALGQCGRAKKRASSEIANERKMAGREKRRVCKHFSQIECFHSHDQHLCKFIETKESVCIRKEFNSQRTGLGHQHGRRFIVLGHQYGRRDVMWKHSIHVPQSAQYSAHEKLILVSKCQMSKRGGVGEFHIIDMFVRLCARDARWLTEVLK